MRLNLCRYPQQILLTKALTFAAPGIGLGLFVAFLINIPVEQQIAGFGHVPPVYALAAEGITAAALVGLIIPILANIVPISRALSRTLRDSLDVYHNVVSETVVTVMKVRIFRLQQLNMVLDLILICCCASLYFFPPGCGGGGVDGSVS